jgi:hypothetical protein
VGILQLPHKVQRSNSSSEGVKQLIACLLTEGNTQRTWIYINALDGIRTHLNNSNLYSQVVTICTTSLTFTNSTFCPHSAFMCFVWISEQTAIISIYINWLVFITETEYVYCAVRTLYITDIITGFNGQPVSSFPPRRQRFDLRPVPMRSVVEKVAHGQALLPAYFGPPPPDGQYLSSPQYCSYHDKRQSLGTPKSSFGYR